MAQQELADLIAGAAACAATPGEHHSRASVVSALEAGRLAAEHGCCIPPPVLLDVGAILGASGAWG